MSDSEQQFMETSENGHEGEEDLNGAEAAEQTEAAVEAENVAEGDEAADDSQNGAVEGGQINASKGEEDAGYVQGAPHMQSDPVLFRGGRLCRFRRAGRKPLFLGLCWRHVLRDGGWALCVN